MSVVEKLLCVGVRLGAALIATALSVGTVGAEVDLPDSSAATVAPTLSGEDAIFYYFSAPPGETDPADAEFLYVYTQRLSGPFTGYESSTDTWLSQQEIYAANQGDKTRPAVATDEDDTYVYFVGTDGNVYKLWLNSGGRAEVISSGDVISVAVSPDNRWLAFTTSSNPDRIQVLDQAPEGGSGTVSYTIPLVDYDPALDSVRVAKSLAFDYSGTQIIFDAWFCDLPGDGSGTCSSDADGYRDIGILNIVEGLADDERFEFPLPAPAAEVDVGYPRFAYNNNFVLVMDYHYPDPDSGQTVAEIRTFNLQPAQGVDPFQRVARLGTTDPDAEPLWGVPSFWGDDDFVTVQTPVADEMMMHRVALDESWAGPADGALDEQLNDRNAHMPVMHRIAASDYAIDVQADRESLDIGRLALGDSRSFELTVTNTGEVDTYITEIELPETVVVEDGPDAGFVVSSIDTPLFLPRGERLKLDVSFNAVDGLVREETQTGTLNFQYGDGETLSIPLLATVGLDTVRADLEADRSAVDFGEFEVGDPFRSNETIVFTNTGDPGETITVFDAEIEGSFVLDFSSFILDGQGSRGIRVGYTAANEPAEHSGRLTLYYGVSEDLSTSMTISLSASTVAAEDEGDGDGTGDEGDEEVPQVDVSPVNEAGVGALVYLLVVLLARCIWRPCRRSARAER